MVTFVPSQRAVFRSTPGARLEGHKLVKKSGRAAEYAQLSGAEAILRSGWLHVESLLSRGRSFESFETRWPTGSL